MRVSRLSILLLIPLLLTGCAERGFDAGPDPVFSTPLPLGETVIYELYPRSFTPEANLQAIIPRLDELKELGVNHIWLMPIHPVGEIERKGTLGSPYSIADYRAINPEFGTMSDFRDLVAAIHARGMFVMLDLVANHTAWDHPWVTQNPDWYVKGDDGEITHPPGTDWTDVAQLDFSNPQVHAAMRGAMRYWIEEENIDGFRADVAEMVPDDFWRVAIAELRRIKPILMLAEGHHPRLHDVGFDLTYSWTTYHPLKDVWRGAPADTLIALVQHELDIYPFNGRLRFTTNHDETAWDATPLELFGGTAGAQAAAVIMATLPGVPLIYNGQEVGDVQRLHLFERIPIQWDTDPQMQAFYRDLLARRATSQSIRRGRFEPIPHDRPADIVAFRRVLDGEETGVIVNVRDRAIEVTFDDGSPVLLQPFEWQIH
jgi:glycosidase